MCCGCCSGCGQFTGSLIYVLEKLVSFCALTAVVVCIIFTLITTLGIGVGLGYNYCFVDLKIVSTESSRPKNSVLRQREEAYQRTADSEIADVTESPSYRRTESTQPAPMRTLPLPAIKHTMVIPLNAEFDFPTLLSKLRGRNRNVTLELIT